MKRRFFVAALCALTLAQPASAQAEGVSIAVLSVGKDSPSDPQAVVVGRIAKQGFERNPKYALLDLEAVLESGGVSTAAQRRRRADAAFARGRSAYEAFELGPALEAFAEAVVSYEQAIAVMDGLEPLLAALKYQGAAFALLGDQKGARASFERALGIDPGFSVAGAGFPDEVTGLIAEASAKVERGESGGLTLYAAPPAAEVWIDGRFRGSAPLSVDNLPVGRHYVRVVKDGYLSFGQPVEITRRGEQTVQATLRPTARFAELDDLLARIKGGSEQAPSLLAGMLKVDQLLYTVVEVAGDDATVHAALIDGVGGSVLASASKAFVSTSPRYRSDLELWLAQTFRQAQGSAVSQSGSGTGGSERRFMPETPREAPTSPKTTLGWALVGGAIIPLALGIGFGLGSLVPWDAYKNEGKLFNQPTLSHQLDNSRQDVWNSFLVTSLIADAGYATAALMSAVGITLLVLGANEKEQIEDVLAGAPVVLPALGALAQGGSDARP
jgi:tetratricopeptide (TPR) repeat protein